MEQSGFFSQFKHLYTIKSFLLMIVGVSCAVYALRGFMMPNHFMDGGVTGISILIHEKFGTSFSALFIPLNLLFFIPAYLYMGKQFAIRSFIAILFIAAGVEFLPITKVVADPVLVAIFGGSFIGLGMGLVIRSGAAIDGLELIAIFITKRIGFSISEVILFFNSILFIAVAKWVGFDEALYSIITYFAALKVADYVVDGIEEFISVTIISKDPDKIKDIIVNQFGKGISVYKGERGYLPGKFDVKTDCDIIVTIVTRLELLDINAAINEADATAFVYTHKIKETTGGIIKRKSGH